MPEPDDIALLRKFVDRNSDEAFTALVSRHVNQACSAALRLLGIEYRRPDLRLIWK